MKHITLHIERLLLHNDCVIVPGLGGFVAQNCSARYVEEEDLFLPPYRSVSFNPRLTMNDGLLVHDIALYHSIEYRDALRIVENEVASIRQAIEDDGQYVFHGVGTLHKSSGAHYEFEPITCGVSAPDLYGLDSYYVSPLAPKKKPAAKLQVRKHDDDTLTLRIPMNAVRHAAVAAVAAVFFFVCIAPLNTAISCERSEAGMLHYLYSLFTRSNNHDAAQPKAIDKTSGQGILAAAAEDAVATTEAPPAEEASTDIVVNENEEISETLDAIVPANTEAATTPVAQQESPALPSAAAKTPPANLPYAIVVASYVTERNAATMIEAWKQKGLPAASVNVANDVTRVFYGTYENYEKAHEALKFLKSEFKTEFAEAWVYEIH